MLAWTTWAGIIAVSWILAFVIAEAIPFFSDLLSLMSALFGAFFFTSGPLHNTFIDRTRRRRLFLWVCRIACFWSRPIMTGFFRFIYWGVAYLTLQPKSKRWSSLLRTGETLFNYFLIAFGLYMLTAGTYVRIIFYVAHPILIGFIPTCDLYRFQL